MAWDEVASTAEVANAMNIKNLCVLKSLATC